MPTPEPFAITQAVGALTDLGLTGIITLGATLFFAGLVYRRFRK